jgi:DNA-binding NarL/FixJ family response regulator
MKILSVDDAPIIVKQLNCILSEIDNVNYIGNAINIKQAHEMIITYKPDIVIIDLKLKEENGIDLLEFINKNYKKIKPIVLSNQNDSFYKSKCMQMGAMFFLDKSYEFDKLIDCINEIKDHNS